MISSDVTAELAFNQDTRGGTGPAGPTITLNIAPDGFFHAGGIGGQGQSLEPMTVEHVAEVLANSFDRARVVELLDHLVRLRDAL